MERQNAVWEAPTDTMDAPHAAGNFMLEVSPMAATKTIRIIKKIQQDGAWRFVTLARNGSRYEWDSRPGTYYIEWWEGARRRREVAGNTPSEALAARRRKQGGIVAEAEPEAPPTRNEVAAATPSTETPIPEARKLFLTHIAAHSPDKPETVRRYSQVLEHFERWLGSKGVIESITRGDMDDYKVSRRQEQSQRHKRLITPRTINFEISTLRTFFYYLINERGVQFENPCTRFKRVRDVNSQASRRPPTYTQDELQRLFEASDRFERATFATLLMTGLRKKELYFLTWRDVDLHSGVLRVTGQGKVGFSPKTYEERTIPLPPDLVRMIDALPRRCEWVFANRNGRRLNRIHSGTPVVRYHQPAHAIEELKRADMGTDPVPQPPRPCRFGIRVITGTEHGDKYISWTSLAGLAVCDQHCLTRMVNEYLFTRPMLVSQYHVQVPCPFAELSAKPAVVISFRETLFVFLPEQLQCNVRTLQLLMDLTEIRNRPFPRRGRWRWRKQYLLQPRIVDVLRQWPRKLGCSGPFQISAYRTFSNSTCACDLAFTHSGFKVKSERLSYLPHGCPSFRQVTSFVSKGSTCLKLTQLPHPSV